MCEFRDFDLLPLWKINLGRICYLVLAKKLLKKSRLSPKLQKTHILNHFVEGWNGGKKRGNPFLLNVLS